MNQSRNPEPPSNDNLIDGQCCETHFLGWDAPFLPRVVEFLWEQYGQDGCFDLSNTVCVLPAARSTNRLQALLRDRATQADMEYWPPEITTVGQLAEHLYKPAGKIATDFEQTLAWSEVLRAMNPQDLLPLLPTLPPAGSLTAWLELAATLQRLRAELASCRLSFADVVESAETESEQRRWRLLDRLHGRYLKVIEQAGLMDPHGARNQAIDDSTCEVDRQVVLVGVSDLSDVLVAMLAEVSDRVTTLVAAPQSHANHFVEFGNVNTAVWLKHELPLSDEQLVVAGDVSDQATAVAEILADFADSFSADQITVGTTDESHVSPIELELRGCGVTTYRQLGWTVTETAIGRLLSLTTSHLQRGTWQTLAALTRHADVFQFVTKEINKRASEDESIKTNWLLDLDQLLANHFPLRVADELPPKAKERYGSAVLVAEIVQDLLSDFVETDGEKSESSKSIARWCETFVKWLNRIYADSETEDNTPLTRTLSALGVVRGLLGRLQNLNDELDVAVSGSVAMEMISSRLTNLRVSDSPQPEDVEILGWLDLPMDDAPAMVLMGLNHPFVPEAVTSDPFLPGALRTQLRMVDNDRRYARDVYAMQLLIATRKSIRFIVGKNAADGSPTPPSRVIAAAPAVDSAQRVRKLLSEQRPNVVVQHRWDKGVDVTNLPIPVLGGADINRMSVTSFSSYLNCPYRFYLRNVLKLRPLDDATAELAANQFGDLVHGALENFGQSSDKDLTDASKIEASLLEHLHDYAADTYGTSVAMAVQLQVKQAELRLKVFAKQQAQRMAEGWIIHEAEASVEEVDTLKSKAAGITVDGRVMGIRGRFDRIDHHPATDRWAILDYKTHGHSPYKKHIKKKDGEETWVDLQLPLYRMLIPFLGIDADPAQVQLGYFNISEKEEETKVNLADFTESQMKSAEQVIHQVIRDIWADKFDPTDERVLYDDYESIMQMRVPQRLINQVDQAEKVFLEDVV